MPRIAPSADYGAGVPTTMGPGWKRTELVTAIRVRGKQSVRGLSPPGAERCSTRPPRPPMSCSAMPLRCDTSRPARGSDRADVGRKVDALEIPPSDAGGVRRDPFVERRAGPRLALQGVQALTVGVRLFHRNDQRGPPHGLLFGVDTPTGVLKAAAGRSAGRGLS
jgi:hypothetical protein